jgi:signal transduction histidine kinase/type II secretory pathway pseudopilin PulG
MARLRLRTQFLFATLLIISLLTGTLLFILRRAVRSEIASQVQEATGASLRAFETVQREHERELSQTAAILAELPTLKALMTTADAPTIQDGSEPFWNLAGSDLFLLASPEGKILGFHVLAPGWSARTTQGDLNESLKADEGSAWWYAEGQLYWVFLRPITAGTGKEQRQLGALGVGYRVDSKVAQQLALFSGSQIVLTASGRVVASTLPSQEEAQLQRIIDRQGSENGGTGREILLDTDQYQFASASIREGPRTPVDCYVLTSLKQTNAFIQRLNKIIFSLGVAALLLAGLLIGAVSRTITRPLEDLVAGAGALGHGDYAYSITPRGSSEVAELGEAFSTMRKELLVAQQRRLAAERIAALGRAAGSISHDLRHHLAAVVANAEFLYEADRLKLNKDEIYEEIKTASNQMVDLLDSLRELAREGTAIVPVTASLAQTVRRAVEAVLASQESRGRTISVDAAGEMEGVFDPKKVERALFNLLLNACEATAAGKGRIEVRIASSAERFEIRVADNGSGVPGSIRDTLFDPFVSSEKPNGTGLGLAIVNKIIRDHNGAVSLETTSDFGTVFLVRLPRLPRAVAADSAPVPS